MNLRLDDDDAAAETARDLAGFGGVERDLAARHGHAVSRENGFGLILVDFHDVSKLLMLIGLARRVSVNDVADSPCRRQP